jgi:predicted nucleic acid-binding protein
LIYAHDADAGFRQRRASEELVELWVAGAGLLSRQVLQEFYVNVTRKIKPPLAPSVAREVVRDYAPWVESPIMPATVVRASEICEIWQLSFWDGMILVAAEQGRANRLLTEDLSHGVRIAGFEMGRSIPVSLFHHVTSKYS